MVTFNSSCQDFLFPDDKFATDYEEISPVCPVCNVFQTHLCTAIAQIEMGEKQEAGVERPINNITTVCTGTWRHTHPYGCNCIWIESTSAHCLLFAIAHTAFYAICHKTHFAGDSFSAKEITSSWAKNLKGIFLNLYLSGCHFILNVHVWIIHFMAIQ